MILCDSSVLVSLVCTDEPEHARCKDAFRVLAEPLITTWRCFGEARYLATRKHRYHRHRLLWEYVDQEVLIFHIPTRTEGQRMRELMNQYKSQPMDLADASLVVAAETLGLTRVFSLDGDFLIYQIHDRIPFEVLPQRLRTGVL